MAARRRGLAEMAVRFVPIDHATRLLFPPDLRGWVPADPLVHFIPDAVEALDLRQVRGTTCGTGSEPYPPRLLLALLSYSHATGTFASRRHGGAAHQEEGALLRRRAEAHPASARRAGRRGSRS